MNTPAKPKDHPEPPRQEKPPEMPEGMDQGEPKGLPHSDRHKTETAAAEKKPPR